ncbi:MAG: WD40 repeat protein [Candidatus Nanohaloarchaea archaeon]|jgi:WD40 repeat protein
MSWNIVASFPEPTDGASSAFSPQGSWIAYGDESGDVNVYSAGDWVHQAELSNSSGSYIYDIAFSQNENYLVFTESNEPNVYTTGDWVEQDPYFAYISSGDEIYSLDFSANGNWLVVGIIEGNDYTDEAYVYESGTWNNVAQFNSSSEGGQEAAFSPDNNYLACANGNTGEIYIYNTSDWSEETVIADGDSNPRGIAFSPKSDYLAVSEGTSEDVKIYETQTWTVEATLTNGTNAPRQVTFDPDGDWLAYGKTGGTYVFRVSDWSFEEQLATASGTAYSRFSPNGDYIIEGYISFESTRAYVREVADPLNQVGTIRIDNGSIFDVPVYSLDTVQDDWLRVRLEDGTVGALMPLGASGEQLRVRDSDGSVWGIKTE